MNAHVFVVHFKSKKETENLSVLIESKFFPDLV